MRLTSYYAENRYAILFYSLLLTLAVGPLSEVLGFGGFLLDLTLAVNLIAAVISIENLRMRRLLFIVLVAVVSGRIAAGVAGGEAILKASLAAWTIVAFLAAVVALRFALRSSTVASEQLYAALSAYLLAGIFCGISYWVLEHSWPGSFVVAGESPATGFSPGSAIYFSFVTLATLGYGDIVPRSEAARGIVIVEAVVGQLYLAVMVARLVSLYVVRGNAR